MWLTVPRDKLRNVNSIGIHVRLQGSCRLLLSLRRRGGYVEELFQEQQYWQQRKQQLKSSSIYPSWFSNCLLCAFHSFSHGKSSQIVHHWNNKFLPTLLRHLQGAMDFIIRGLHLLCGADLHGFLGQLMQLFGSQVNHQFLSFIFPNLNTYSEIIES